MPKYRKKPVVIEAFQLPLRYDGPSFMDWAKQQEFKGWRIHGSGDAETLVISTLEGEMQASPGDWIIKGVKGEFYPCKPDIFAATYDPVP